MRRQGLEHRAFIAIKSHLRHFERGAMQAQVRLAGAPGEGLLVKIRVVQELPTIEKALPYVADRPLDLALGSRPIRPTGANAKTPVRRKAHELGVLQELAADLALILDDHGLHLIEQQLRRYPTERHEGLLEATHQHRKRLPLEKLQPQDSRI